jgi:hypothetical protein
MMCQLVANLTDGILAPEFGACHPKIDLLVSVVLVLFDTAMC